MAFTFSTVETILAFLIVLGILVIVHEFGHFIVAKLVGVKVEEFAVGFPPRLFSKKKGETEYSINLIPLGGYVKMLGELEHSKDKRAFENQKPGKRFYIAVAGVIMNLVLAWLILTVGFSVGMTPIVSSPESIPGKKISNEIILANIEKDSAAEKASLKQNDILLGAKSLTDSANFSSAEEITDFSAKHRGQEITLSIKREGKDIEQKILLSDSDRPLGITMIDKTVVRVPFYKAPYVALKETSNIVKVTLEFLGGFFAKLFSTGRMADEVGGPVAIYVYTGLALKAGIMVLLQFIAILSVNLALINILPFPALDGGRIVFIILEKLFGKKVIKEQVEGAIHMIGYALLILFVIAVTYKDIVKIFVK